MSTMAVPASAAEALGLIEALPAVVADADAAQLPAVVLGLPVPRRILPLNTR